MQLDGQKAFMTGKLKIKGNMMFANKLDTVLKVRCSLTSSIYTQYWGRFLTQAAKTKAKL